MGYLEKIAEERILDAMRRGDFDQLPGAGKPLLIEDLSMVPPELRMAYKILKNGGCLPPELELHSEIRRLSELLPGLDPGEERRRAIRRLEYLSAKLGLMRGRDLSLAIEQRYYAQVLEKLNSGKEDEAGRG